MAFAAGTYTLPAGNPVVTNTPIASSWANTTLSDIATALSTCVLKDGTQTITANLPMAGFKLTGLGVGSAAADSVRMSQLQDNTVSYLTGTAGTNTITASGSPTVTALTAGQRFTFIPANTNTAATTLQIDSTAATNIFWNNAALVGGEIRQNVPVTVFYDGTQYQLIASAAMANTYAVPDNALQIQAAGDRTKMFIIAVTGVSTSTTVTMVVPASSFTPISVSGTQTLTNKTLTSPTINTLVTGSAIATQADQEAATALNLIVTPGAQHFHPSALKAFGMVSGNTVVVAYPSGAGATSTLSGNTYVIKHGRTFSSIAAPIGISAYDPTTVNVFPYNLLGVTTTGFFVTFYTISTAGIVTQAAPQALFYQIAGDL